MTDPHIIAIAEVRGRGLVFSRDLVGLGLNPRGIRKALVDGLLVRVARGAFAVPPAERPFWPSELHALAVRATIARASSASVVSHLSAAAVHDLPVVGRWPAAVHVTIRGASGGSSSVGITRHTGGSPVPEVEVAGVRVTSIARTLVDVASTQPFLVGVTMCDAALRRGVVTIDGLADELAATDLRRGAQKAARCFAFADARAASPGESVTRVNTWQLGLELPELQVAALTRLGSFDCDFGWEGCALFGEFDGKVKYTRDAFMKGRTVSEVVLDEKRREDAIRAATRRSFVRILWNEALMPRTLYEILTDAGVPERRRPL